LEYRIFGPERLTVVAGMRYSVRQQTLKSVQSSQRGITSFLDDLRIPPALVGIVSIILDKPLTVWGTDQVTEFMQKAQRPRWPGCRQEGTNIRNVMF